MSNKTPIYTLKAVKRYEQKVTKKNISLNPDIESDLIKAIESDKTAFSTLVKRLLRKHYNLD